jgi:hypothetical protein
LGEQKENPRVGCFPKMVEEYGYYRDPSWFQVQLSQVGVAFSGGGLRATLSGAGIFDDFDSRSTTATPDISSGKPTVNGLLDFTTYVTGALSS